MPKAEEKKKDKQLLYGGLLASSPILAGLGMKGFSGALFNDRGDKAMGRFSNQEALDQSTGQHLSADPSVANSFRVLRDYAANGSDLMNSKLLGMAPKTVIKGLRSLPGLSEANKWKGEGSDLHYDAFKDGELPGFIRYFDERFEKDQYPQQDIGLMDKLKMKFNPGAFRKEFAKSINDYIGGKTGVKNYIDGTGASDVPTMSNPGIFDAAQQKALLTGYGKYVEENGSRELRHQIQAQAPAAYRSYDKYRQELIKPVEQVQDTFNGLGNTLLGAGAGGGLGTLAGHFATKDPKNHKRNMLIGGLSGAALGGLGTAYLT